MYKTGSKINIKENQELFTAFVVAVVFLVVVVDVLIFGSCSISVGFKPTEKEKDRSRRFRV